jgi:hypothetical protein
MAAHDFLVSMNVRMYYFEGNPMLKFKIRGNQRAKAMAMLKWLNSVKKDDARPAPATSKLAKVLVLDPAITGMSDAVTLIRNRLIDVLAKVP